MGDRAVLSRVNLVLGGARSGKRSYGESLIDQSGLSKVYLATAAPGEAEMAARIAAHRAQRGADWTTIEAPLGVPKAIAERAGPDTAILLDCLTPWLANLLGADRDPEREFAALLAALADVEGAIVLVSNEVGLGIMPDDACARAFRDHLGRLNCALGAAADLVVFMAAGLPLVLKSPEWDPIKRNML